MRVRVKICGIRDRCALDGAVEAGADAIGLVFAESVRRVTLEEGAALREAAAPFVAVVAVFGRPRDEDVLAVRRAVDPDLFQFDAGTALTPPGLEAVAGRWLPVLRDGPALRADAALLSAGMPALFEAARSGAGVTPDWERIREASRGRLAVLAGGLTPDNVREAIRIVRPFAVDVSSGVERAPGDKCPARMRAFVDAVRDVRSPEDAP